MKPAHVNCATLAGVVEDLKELEPRRLSRRVLKFYLNTTPHLAGGLDVGNRHLCIVAGDPAEQLAKTVHEGAALRVGGPLHVNSQARRDLYLRIAKIAVHHATVIHPAPTARQLLPCVFGVPGLDMPNASPPPNLEGFARNEVHLLGRVTAIRHEDDLTRVTLSTLAPFRATHDVVAWSEKVDPTLTVGAITRVSGLLSHDIENWSDGQIRLLSRVHAESIPAFDGTTFPTDSLPSFTPSVARVDTLGPN